MRSRTMAAVLPLLLLVAAAVDGQVARGIFVTPIPDAPFSGTVQVERTVIQPNGSQLRLTSMRVIARDNLGRIHTEMRAMVPVSVRTAPALLVVHVYDPQNRMNEYLYPQQKTYRMQMLDRPPATDTIEDYGSPSSASLPASQYTRQDDLGQRTIAGLPAHGVRITQTLPPDVSGTDAEVVVTDEYWYSEELRMNLAVRHNDPRTGSFAATVTAVTRGQPDEGLFSVPAGYRMAGLRGN